MERRPKLHACAAWAKPSPNEAGRNLAVAVRPLVARRAPSAMSVGYHDGVTDSFYLVRTAEPVEVVQENKKPCAGIPHMREGSALSKFSAIKRVRGATSKRAPPIRSDDTPSVP